MLRFHACPLREFETAGNEATPRCLICGKLGGIWNIWEGEVRFKIDGDQRKSMAMIDGPSCFSNEIEIFFIYVRFKFDGTTLFSIY